MAYKTIAESFADLRKDPWRQAFSGDIQEVHDTVFKMKVSEDEIITLLRSWLQRNQPCLFGRIAAKLDLLTFCIIQEAELFESDEYIHDKIQTARLEWTRDAFKGRKNGFIVAVISPILALAEPNRSVFELAQRLCSLYLQKEQINADEIYLDEIFLEEPGMEKETRRFYTGVNYFSTQGDKRWWHDHRFPGGLALSVNSVGHLVRSGNIAKNLEIISKDYNITLDTGWVASPVDSLSKALELAMRTISMAAETPWGRATELKAVAEDDPNLPKCPIDLTGNIAEKSHCEYKGFYHTDVTLPSDYFLPEIRRPNGTIPFDLDLTYLFLKDVDNPDFYTMGEGKRIRTAAITRRSNWNENG